MIPHVYTKICEPITDYCNKMGIPISDETGILIRSETSKHLYASGYYYMCDLRWGVGGSINEREALYIVEKSIPPSDYSRTYYIHPGEFLRKLKEIVEPGAYPPKTLYDIVQSDFKIGDSVKPLRRAEIIDRKGRASMDRYANTTAVIIGIDKLFGKTVYYLNICPDVPWLAEWLIRMARPFTFDESKKKDEEDKDFEIKIELPTINPLKITL